MDFQDKTRELFRIIVPIGFIIGVLGLIFFVFFAIKAAKDGEVILTKEVIGFFFFIIVATFFLGLYCRNELGWFQKRK